LAGHCGGAYVALQQRRIAMRSTGGGSNKRRPRTAPPPLDPKLALLRSSSSTFTPTPNQPAHRFDEAAIAKAAAVEAHSLATGNSDELARAYRHMDGLSKEVLMLREQVTDLRLGSAVARVDAKTKGWLRGEMKLVMRELLDEELEYGVLAGLATISAELGDGEVPAGGAPRTTPMAQLRRLVGDSELRLGKAEASLVERQDAAIREHDALSKRLHVLETEDGNRQLSGRVQVESALNSMAAQLAAVAMQCDTALDGSKKGKKAAREAQAAVGLLAARVASSMDGEELKPGWTSHVSSSGLVYYYHKESGLSSWKRPLDEMGHGKNLNALKQTVMSEREMRRSMNLRMGDLEDALSAVMQGAPATYHGALDPKVQRWLSEHSHEQASAKERVETDVDALKHEVLRVDRSLKRSERKAALKMRRMEQKMAQLRAAPADAADGAVDGGEGKAAGATGGGDGGGSDSEEEEDGSDDELDYRMAAAAERMGMMALDLKGGGGSGAGGVVRRVSDLEQQLRHLRTRMDMAAGGRSAVRAQPSSPSRSIRPVPGESQWHEQQAAVQLPAEVLAAPPLPAAAVVEEQPPLPPPAAHGDAADGLRAMLPPPSFEMPPEFDAPPLPPPTGGMPGGDGAMHHLAMALPPPIVGMDPEARKAVGDLERARKAEWLQSEEGKLHTLRDSMDAVVGSGDLPKVDALLDEAASFGGGELVAQLTAVERYRTELVRSLTPSAANVLKLWKASRAIEAPLEDVKRMDGKSVLEQFRSSRK